MKHLKGLLTVIVISLCITKSYAYLSALYNVLNYFSISSNNTTPSDELGISRGQSHYSFESFALLGSERVCMPDDKHILHLLQEQLGQPVRKPPIMIKCLEMDTVDNGTTKELKLHIMENTKDILQLLKPIGNATKRHEHGSCVIVHFCTPTSVSCAHVANLINLLPYMFQTLRIAYIDAYKFPNLNAEFGVVALPTLMIFHQGRPIVKYHYEDHNYLEFITRHTNIPSLQLPQSFSILGPLPDKAAVQTDFYLGMAWTFIFICLANYVRRTLLWKQLVEMVKRNWRESEEIQMEMVD